MKLKDMKDYKHGNKYRIADIAVEIRDGVPFYWIYYLGYHVEQGGRSFGEGNLGTEDLESACNMLKMGLKEAEEDIVSRVKEREEK